ncbi:MAG TPA: putative toxin-antitoxin system toxin component, PIN family [Terriglobia bacterium]|nr:putative toxin-antitoxin system toxin component, PIN family [Terriglobia bacterium]
MLKVVLDTNVLISALAFQGETRKIWDLAERREFHLFTSAFVLSELERNRLRLGSDREQTAVLLRRVKEVASVVTPTRRISAVLQHDADNRIMECAVEAQADALVTGNLKHIRPLASYEGISILTPREFLTTYFLRWLATGDQNARIEQ